MAKQRGVSGAGFEKFASENYNLGDFKRHRRKRQAAVKVSEFARALRPSQAGDRQVRMKGARLTRESNFGTVVFQCLMQLRQDCVGIFNTNPQDVRFASRGKCSTAGER